MLTLMGYANTSFGEAFQITKCFSSLICQYGIFTCQMVHPDKFYCIVCISFFLFFGVHGTKAEMGQLNKIPPYLGNSWLKDEFLNSGIRMIHFRLIRFAELRYSICLFFCVEVLQPSQPSRVMSSTVSLPNHTLFYWAGLVL